MSSQRGDDQGGRGTDAGDAEQAALEEVEPDRLLAGEEQDTRHAEDAVHWIKVYTELLEFKRSVLATTEESVETMDPDASREVTETDLKALLAEALRFERRLTFWRARASELQGEPG